MEETKSKYQFKSLSLLKTESTLLGLSKLNLTNSLLTSSSLTQSHSKLDSSFLLKSDLKKKLHEETSLLDNKKPKISLENNLFQKSQLVSTIASTNLNLNLNSHLKTSLNSFKNLQLKFKENESVKTTLNNSLANNLLKKSEIGHKSNEIIEKPVLKRKHSEEKLKENELIDEFYQIDSLINSLKSDIGLESAKRLKRLQKTTLIANPLIVDKITNLQRYKSILINSVSSSLLRQPNFKDVNDATRANILNYANLVALEDAEFVLKLALYTRRELNIRVTANFLISLASFKNECRPYLQKYFNNSIMLPSDWIDVAEQYQLFMDKKINFGSLPNALRKCMVEKFPQFDAYQLAKYNKEKSRLNKNNSLKEVKHVRSKLKDDQGKESETIEDKYIKTIPKGFKQNDRVLIEMIINTKCDSVKFDIIKRDEVNTKKAKKGQASNANIEYEETVAVRTTFDYQLKRILLKSCINKVWSKRADCVYPEEKFSFSLGFEQIKFFIDIEINCFKFGTIDSDGKEQKLCSYPHSRHNVELNKLNILRISGVDIKLKDLKIVSKEQINWDHQMSEETEQEIKKRSYTLKQLIRQLHIAKPVTNVLSLLGKKYPESFEEFIQLKLEGEYDSTRAGKRMKLPVPETWETQISMHGNKAEVWQRLIDNKKLPYMAMLRNLRNMIKSGISDKHHIWVIKKLQDEGAVINSKQFPFRFFTAYEILDELLDELKNFNSGTTNPVNVVHKKKNTKKEKPETEIKYNEELIKRYKTALDNALKVATRYNVSPIKGSTLIVLNIGNEMMTAVSGSARSLGKKVTTIADIASLMGLMLKYACEYSKLNIFRNGSIYKDIQLEPGTILDNMKSLTDLSNINSYKKVNISFSKEAFIEILQNRDYFDNLVFIGNGGVGDVEFLKSFLRKYRAYINKDLLFVNINLAVSECGLINNTDFNHENDVCISGYSDSVLRFIAERGNGLGQLVHIDNIDKSYELPELKTNSKILNSSPVVNKINKSTKIPKQIISNWKTIKVFISSTFRDMHSERDILTKTVFPLLRSKLASYRINIHEIDMRWGITEHEANSNETLSLCVNQILNADYFIGILGNRYGMVLNEYKTGIDWIQYYPPGASITELEFETQIRKSNFEKTFFYFRDNNSFIDTVPDEIKNHFEDESNEANFKLIKLKDRVKSKPFEIFNNYKSKWYKLDENNRALLTGLDEFAERVFNNLYNAILKHDCQNTETNLKENELTKMNNAYIEAFGSLFTGRRKLITKLDKFLKETTQIIETTSSSTDSSLKLIQKQNSIVNICLCLADAGCGKTTFLCHYYLNYLFEISQFSFGYSVGSFESSELVLAFLKCFCIHVLNYYKIFTVNEFDAEANDFNYFKKVFNSILEQFHSSEHSKHERFFILIDGVDNFVDENGNLDESFNWLPDLIPPSITFILSARNTSSTRTVLNRLTTSNKENNTIKLNLFEIDVLDVLDKSEIVKSKLSKFNKKLDESAFNNQMKLLTGKREANNPLYLALACEELRVHNQFETLTSKLKELPVRTNLLINYVLERLENEYGAKFVTAAFMFISCSKDGLTEQELFELIQLYFSFKNPEYEFNCLNTSGSILEVEYLEKLFFKRISRVSTSKYLSFLQTITDTFLKPRGDKNGLICLKSHSLIENAIRFKYNDKSQAALDAHLTVKLVNKLMALYNWHLIDEKFYHEWSLNSQRAYINLPYHLSYSESYFDLVNVLCDLKFIANKSELEMASLLLDDFDLSQTHLQKNLLYKKKLSLKQDKNSPVMSKRFNDYKEFISNNFHILSLNPNLIYQQAVNQEDDSHVASDVLEILDSDSKINGCLFEWKNKKASNNEKKIKPLTLTSFSDTVSSVSFSKNGDLVACGTENCEIKLYSISTANLMRTLQGHSGRINQLCFANNSTLVSVSSDGIANIWSINGGYRIKALNNHNGHVVSGCSAELSGRTFMTCGWDCNVKIWDSNEGKLQGELKGHPKPINCIIFNPDGFTVATGGWDSAIRIFNVVNRNRIAVLRSHKTSIRSMSYSQDGVYIASASIDGEVKLWNSKTGSNLATLKGHSLPVNSLRFSPNNQFLITGSSDRRVRVWSGNVGKIVRIIRDKNTVITSVCFESKNGELIAAGYHDGEIKVFETHTGCMKLKVKVHEKPVKRVKYSNFGNFLISSSEDGSVKIIDLKSNGKIAVELIGNTKSVNAFDINLKNTVITCSEDCLINIYDSVNFGNYDDDFEDNLGLFDDTPSKPIEKIKFEKYIKPKKILNVHKSAITSCAFNSTGDKFATASKDANIIIFSLDQYSLEVNELHNISNAHLDWITDLSWSNSSEFILTASNDYSLKIWNTETGKETTQLTGHTSNINSCAFKYGCGVSASSDGKIKIWSHKGFEVASLTGHQKRVNSCDLYFKVKLEDEPITEENITKSWGELVDENEWNETHQNKSKKIIVVEHVYLVTCSDDSTIRIWKPNESDFIKSLENHNNKINQVDLSSNDLIATASSDKTVNIFNMKEFFTEYTSGQFVNAERLVKNHNSEITSIVFSKSNFMLSSSRDGLLLIWKCNTDFNDTLKSIDFVQELQAHSKSINKILILKEKQFQNKDSFEFATCSDDRLVKIWKLTQMEDETVLVELIKTIRQNASVAYMFTHQISETEYYLASLQVELNRLVLIVYDIKKKYVQVSNKGFQIVNLNGMIQNAKKTDSNLYITLIHDEIYKLSLKEIFSKTNIYNFEYKDEAFKKERILTGVTNDISNWYSGIDEEKQTTFTVDSKGGLYASNENRLEFRKLIHSNRVDEMLKFKVNGSNRYVTSSQDCTVKIWSDDFVYQLGQYNTYAAITTIELKETKNFKYNFVFGDQFGNLYLVVWHDNN